jgi:hypothetical protein
MKNGDCDLCKKEIECPVIEGRAVPLCRWAFGFCFCPDCWNRAAEAIERLVSAEVQR